MKKFFALCTVSMFAFSFSAFAADNAGDTKEESAKDKDKTSGDKSAPAKPKTGDQNDAAPGKTPGGDKK